MGILLVGYCSTKKGCLSIHFPELLLFLDLEDLLAIVVAAFGANAMGTDHLPAMGASGEAGDFELEVGAAETLSGFGSSSLWDCHWFLPPERRDEL